MWALQRLRKLLTTEYGQSININRLLGDSDGEARSMVSQHLKLKYNRRMKKNMRVIKTVSVAHHARRKQIYSNHNNFDCERCNCF